MIRYVRRRSVRIREDEVGDGLSLLVGEEVVMLNRSGRQIWRALSEPTAIEELVDALATAYEGDLEAIAADVRTTVDDFVRRGLVDAVDVGGT